MGTTARAPRGAAFGWIALLAPLAVLAGSDDGFLEASIDHRGYEQIIAGRNVNPAHGLQLPTSYTVTDVALSGDGQRLWLVAYHEFSTPQYLVWSLNTDGSGAQQSATENLLDVQGSPVNISGTLRVRSDLDGDVALLDSGFQYWRARPGQALEWFSNLGLSEDQTRVADDGSFALLLDRWNRRIFHADLTANPPTLSEIAGPAFFRYLGLEPSGFTGLKGFDMSADGSDWYVAGDSHDSSVDRRRYWLNHGLGTSAPDRLIEDLGGDERPLKSISTTDDGLTFGYCHEGAAPNSCFLQAAGGSSRVEFSDGVYNLGGLVLADDGSRVYLISAIEGGGAYGYFQASDASWRRIVGSQRLLDSPNPTPPRDRTRLSDDGQVLATPTSRGAYVMHDGAPAPAGFPQILRIVQRYDDTADQLVVRVQIQAPDGFERVYTLPMYRGLEPNRYLSSAENPLFDERGGGGVNFSTLFTPVSGLTGWHERRINLAGKRQRLNTDFRLRLVLVDHTGQRTAFYDFTPNAFGAAAQVQSLSAARDHSERPRSDGGGRYVVLQTLDDGLDGAGANGFRNIVRIDTRCDPQAEPCQRFQRVSLDDDDQLLAGDASEPAISADGQLVLFVAEDAAVAKVAFESAKAARVRHKAGTFAMFLRNMLTGSTQRLATVAAASGVLPQIAADGSAVVFPAANSDPAVGVVDQVDIQHLPLQATAVGGQIEFLPKPEEARCVSCKTIGSDGRPSDSNSNGPSSQPVVSADGQWVAWQSAAPNLMAQTLCPQASSLVLMRHMLTGQMRSVGLPSQASACGDANAGSRAPSIDHSGQRLAYESDRALKPDDSNGVADIYLNDFARNSSEWVSRSDGTAQPDGASTQPSLSGDGQVVGFVSAAGNIDSSSADGNGVADIYLRSFRSGQVRRLSTTRSGGESDAASQHPALNYNGSKLLFDSAASNLSVESLAGTVNVYQRSNPLGTRLVFQASFE